ARPPTLPPSTASTTQQPHPSCHARPDHRARHSFPTRRSSDLPNAFRYRNEIVAGCTCNGKNPAGLAQVKVEDDPTLRKGDIVAGADGLVVASRNANDRRGVAMNFSPLPRRSLALRLATTRPSA